MIAKKDEELEELRKELIEKEELKEEAFGVIRSLSDMALSADGYISWIHCHGFNAATRPKYRMFQLQPKLKAEVNTHGVLAGEVVEKWQRINCKVAMKSTKDDVATSYAPIGGSGRKPKTLLPMYKKTDIDPFATPMKRRVGLDSVKVSLNSSDYK